MIRSAAEISDHHADGREHDEDRVLEDTARLRFEELDRQEQRHRRAGQRQDLQETLRIVSTKLPPKVSTLPAGNKADDRAGADQH